VNAEQYKIIASAIVLDNFTVRDLSEHSEVKVSTVKAWLNRNKGQRVEVTGQLEVSSPGGGRRQQIWRVKESARGELLSLVDRFSSALRKDLVTAEEARAAFEDPEARIRVRTHLLTAARTDDEDRRAQELQRAKKWLAHQEKVFKAWAANGYEPPPALNDEVASLRNQTKAFDLGVDRLGNTVQLRSLSSAAAWLSAGFEAWFAADHPKAEAPFAPLGLSRNERPAKQITTIIGMCEEVARIPADRLVVALLICLGRMKAGAARRAVCDTLLIIDIPWIVRALHSQLDDAQSSFETRRAIVHIMAGLRNFPRLVYDGMLGGWFEFVRNSSLWCDEIAPFYADIAIRQPRTVETRVVEGIFVSLRRVLDKIRAQDPVWMSMTEGLEVPQPIDGQVVKWISAAESEVSRGPWNPAKAVDSFEGKYLRSAVFPAG
jgi:hypothetical protein